MRTVVQSSLAVAVVVSTIASGSAGIEPAAASHPQLPAVRSISPDPGRPVGVGHPVVVSFQDPVGSRAAVQDAMAVASWPPRSGSYEWLDASTVQWVPDRYWPAHATVLLSVGGKKTQFSTGSAVIGVADISEHTFTVTIDGIGATADGMDATPGGTPDGIDPPGAIELPSPHHLPHAGEAGVLLASMGRPEYATPVGKYTVLAKQRDVVMDSSSVGIPKDHPDGYLLDVDYAVRFTHRGLFVHSAPWAVPSIGFDNVSHGCVSLIPAAAEWYFHTVNVGDPIIVQE
ncbi:L,D-transpeptidase [Mycolicibacterium fallax]|uniref:L,D-TPase catalytic domain-containing protein n=1 Tax=Mycolicibacterium fallax TaxID=1793 RepID=A0A1X1RJD2_MYCFA|nr:L,D-transpeptidase [Mycolicibacterium fallax]ORV07734.1 hypothetical protein AWC04_03340 [Mycolicibacterium fallax]BBY99197.1 hypothetical protein MFAL_26640 [Mycolicibacterium fallax]